MTASEEQAGSERRRRVAETLERIRAGVRQRQGELATLGERGESMRLTLLELKTHEFLEEPRTTSPRPVVGRFLVFARRAVFHLFFKWYLRPIVQQQNAFNEAASRLLQDLSTQTRDLQLRLGLLAARLEEATGDPDLPSGERAEGHEP